MANITLTIPDAQLARVVSAFSIAYGYQDTIPGATPADPPVPNPETRAQFMRRHIMEFVRNTVQAVEANVAAEAARTAEIAKPPVDVS